ncbi:uncharacterized protein AB675_3147 [Cyphellophora attinorum]|uniref:Ca3427-like PBP 2 domain-containing protein n=1 Tax=Cyphellophora attinorum TaxID=1664694 RepID=A0A0N1H138_9EURO|nr:uncharacterized protein AB675_3147 [Phialophora attinorum]KPI37893.1 hypothetical protein AB675_3147 [Phialophora attinorum]
MSASPLRIGFVPEHYLLPLHLAYRASLFPYPVELVSCPSGTGQMITLIREEKLDLAIGLTEGWVAGLLTPQGQKEKGYSIVGSWVENPLRWSIVTGKDREGLHSVKELLTAGKEKGKVKVGVSRMGSGSHIMAIVLAQREGWNVEDQVSFEILGPFKELRDGVNKSSADFFMWEHFTTKGYWEGEQKELKWLGEIYTPWPSWCVVASQKRFEAPEGDPTLRSFFEAVDKGKEMFLQQQDECVRLLGTRELGCFYGEEDAREWLKGAKFFNTTEGIDTDMVDGVVKVLQGAGVLSADVTKSLSDGTIGVRRTP